MRLLYADGEPMALLDVRSSWTVNAGSVRPLGARPAPGGRERQRSRIRERILAIGKTSIDGLGETRRILRERIAARVKP